MPTWNFKPADKMENTVLELIRQMGWMFSKLDSKNVKRLDTNETTIKSADGTTYIHGPILEMRDSTTQMRLEMGYDATSGDFIFRLYDANGNLTIDLNSLGEAVFMGNIETAKSVTVGELLKLISPTATFNSGVQMISNDGVTLLARMLRVAADLLITNYGTGDIDIVSGGDINLSATGGVVLDSSSYVGSKVAANSVATQGWVEAKNYAVESLVTDSFTTADGKTILVNHGVITDIILP